MATKAKMPPSPMLTELEVLLNSFSDQRHQLENSLDQARTLIDEIDRATLKLKEFGYSIPDRANKLGAQSILSSAQSYMNGTISAGDVMRVGANAAGVALVGLAVGAVVELVGDIVRGLKRTRVESKVREMLCLYAEGLRTLDDDISRTFERLPYEKLYTFASKVSDMPIVRGTSLLVQFAKLQEAMLTYRMIYAQSLFIAALLNVHESKSKSNLSSFLEAFYAEEFEPHQVQQYKTFTEECEAIRHDLGEPEWITSRPKVGHIGLISFMMRDKALNHFPTVTSDLRLLRWAVCKRWFTTLPFTQGRQELNKYVASYIPDELDSYRYLNNFGWLLSITILIGSALYCASCYMSIGTIAG